jgi:hypothetical protein
MKLFLMLGVIGCVAGACGDDTKPLSDAQRSDKGLQITERGITDGKKGEAPLGKDQSGSEAKVISFAGSVQPLLSASCTIGACHVGPNPKAGLDLTEGNSYANLVNVTSQECPSNKRVAPGEPDSSYLLQKLEGAGSCFQQAKMPIGGGFPSFFIEDTIRPWIASGAPNN